MSRCVFVSETLYSVRVRVRASVRVKVSVRARVGARVIVRVWGAEEAYSARKEPLIGVRVRV